MFAPAPIRPPAISPKEEQWQLASGPGQDGLVKRLQVWQTVLLAELLNLLEGRRYDLK